MLRSYLLPAFALFGPLALAQTSSQSTHRTGTTGTAHRATSSTAARKSAAARPDQPECYKLASPLSDKIPALPTGTGCPKVLFTVSDRLDYISPLAERYRTTLFADLPVVISLGYADLQAGTGELARPQQYYTVKYTGYLPDGTKFDASDDHDETKAGFTFPYGAHRVIAGWDLGFEGMHIGGKRRLYIPYQFAYGAGGQPPKIPPKSMLIFDMELLSQSATPPTPPKPPTPPTGSPGAAPDGAPTAPASPGAPASPAAPAATPATPGSQTAPPKPAASAPAAAPPTSSSDGSSK